MNLPNPLNASFLAQRALTPQKDLGAQAKQAKGDAQMQKIAQDFEAVFIRMLLKQMRKTVPESELMGNDAGTKMYREMLDNALAEEMAESGTFGISQAIYEQLKKSQ